MARLRRYMKNLIRINDLVTNAIIFNRYCDQKQNTTY
jgi:hypothetical protein